MPLILFTQVPSELRLPDLKEGDRTGMSLEQQLRREADDLLIMQRMARCNQRCVMFEDDG
jgi:hypothetical protein